MTKGQTASYLTCDDHPDIQVVDFPGQEYVYAYCPKCHLMHAWDDEDAAWFGLDVYDLTGSTL